VRADVLATALMVMGLDSGKSFVEKSEIEALIVYEENGKVLSWHSPDFFHIQDRDVAIR
jgi:thiamine biosynthesis lipoprotein ApbE